MRALIIEDDEGVKMCIAAALRGYTIHYAETLSSALQVLPTGTFDLVFIDLGLPDSTPENTIKSIPAIKQLAGRAGLVISTGYATVIDCIALTVDSVIYKPFTSLEVQEAIKDCQKAAACKLNIGYGVKPLLSLFAICRAAACLLALSLSGCVSVEAELPTKYGHFKAKSNGTELLLGYEK